MSYTTPSATNGLLIFNKSDVLPVYNLLMYQPCTSCTCRYGILLTFLVTVVICVYFVSHAFHTTHATALYVCPNYNYIASYKLHVFKT